MSSRQSVQVGDGAVVFLVHELFIGPIVVSASELLTFGIWKM